MVIVGSDSHTPTHGAFGAFATGIGRTEAAAVLATGTIWLRVPETVRVLIDGELPPWVVAKDVALSLVGALGADGADYASLEFAGTTVEAMSVASRMVLTNMAAEMGAKNAFVAPDCRTRAWLQARGVACGDWTPVLPDPDAAYERVLDWDVSALAPQVAIPHRVDNVAPVAEVAGVSIDQALIGTCTNGRLEDLASAAAVLRGRRVADGVRLLVLPASRRVLLEALKQHVIADLVAAGATVLNPGCGPCLGAHEGCMAPGEVTISTANRNFQGRMGSRDSAIYLASPATVAASAVMGEIVDPRGVADGSVGQ